MPEIAVDRPSLRFGGLVALSEVDLSIPDRSLYALIGPNEASETSLANCLTGYDVGIETAIMTRSDSMNRTLAARRPPWPGRRTTP